VYVLLTFFFFMSYNYLLMLFNFNLLCFYAMEMGLSRCLSMYAFVETSMDFQEWEHSTKEEKTKGKVEINRHSC